MSLIELKNHLLKVRVATLSSLCACFNAKPDTMRCMLKHWVNKGKLRCCVKPACGSTCFKCPEGSMEFYEWIDGANVQTV